MVARDDMTMAHQPQVVARISTEILHDVAVGHPFRDRREPPILKGVKDSNEIEKVGMGQALPHDNLFAEALHSM